MTCFGYMRGALIGVYTQNKNGFGTRRKRTNFRHFFVAFCEHFIDKVEGRRYNYSNVVEPLFYT